MNNANSELNRADEYLRGLGIEYQFTPDMTRVLNIPLGTFDNEQINLQVWDWGSNCEIVIETESCAAYEFFHIYSRPDYSMLVAQAEDGPDGHAIWFEKEHLVDALKSTLKNALSVKDWAKEIFFDYY